VAELWTHADRIRAWADDERILRASLEALSQYYSEIELPLVIVTGDADRVLDPKQHAVPLHKTIPHSKLIVLPGTGHQLPQTRADAVIAAIDQVWQLRE